jgi:mono/diheme cytochrome c family protein
MILNKIYALVSPVLIVLTFMDWSGPVLKEADYVSLISVKYQEKSNLQKSISRGRDIYTDFCMQCHLATGKGDLVNFPPLDGSDWLIKKRKQSIHAVKYGQTGEVTVKGKKFNNIMPPLGLENQEVADVLNFIMNSWSNKQKKMVTLEEVKAVMQ